MKGTVSVLIVLFALFGATDMLLGQVRTPVALTYGIQPHYTVYRYYYALERGIVKPEGINVTVKKMDPAQINNLLAGGVMDAGEMSLADYILTRLKGAQLKAIATDITLGEHGNGVFVLAKSPIKTPKDLEGKQLGIHSFAGSSTQYIKGILREKYGVQLDKVIWLSKPVPVLQGLLSEGKVDAAELFGDFYYKSHPDPKYRLLFSTGDVWKKITGSAAITNVVVIKTEILAKYPWLAKNLLVALRKSRDYSDPHLEEITDLFVKERGGDSKYLKSTAPHIQINFTLTDAEKKAIDKWIEYAVEQKLIPNKMSIDDLFTDTVKELG